MHTIRRISAMRAARAASPGPVVLVPTMGALHAGHGALIQTARKKAGEQGTVVVSIFVNPIQFGPTEDLSRYPRPLAADQALCRSHGTDFIFLPKPDEIHPPGHSTIVDEQALSQYLCGRSRPGHFRGVCTVVAKLFAIINPDIAIFGEKDFQQLAIIRRMTRDLHLPVKIVGHPTVRESDGLALSSRNTYLSPAERAEAPKFHAALETAAAQSTPKAILTSAKSAIQKIPGAKIDYIELVDPKTLEPTTSLASPARLIAAIYLGSTRLIDNVAAAGSRGAKGTSSK